MPIQWRAKMSVSDQAIDQDHKRLIQLINLYEAAVTAGNCIQLRAVFDHLVAFAKEHFKREELIQIKIGYPHAVEHSCNHHELLNSITTFTERLCPYKLTVCPSRCNSKITTIKPKEVNDFLHHWFIDHVIHTDLQMKPFLERARLMKIYPPSDIPYWKPTLRTGAI
jgi:hemerythrin